MGDPQKAPPPNVPKRPLFKNSVGGIPKVDRKSEMKYVFVTYETRIPMWFRKKVHPPSPKFKGGQKPKRSNSAPSGTPFLGGVSLGGSPLTPLFTIYINYSINFFLYCIEVLANEQMSFNMNKNT